MGFVISLIMRKSIAPKWLQIMMEFLESKSDKYSISSVCVRVNILDRMDHIMWETSVKRNTPVLAWMKNGMQRML